MTTNNLHITSTVPWTDMENSTPIDDLRNAQKICGDNTGYFGHIFEMHSKTLDQIGSCNQTKKYINPIFMKMSMDEFLELMWGHIEGPVTPKNSCRIDDRINIGDAFVKSINDDKSYYVVKYTGF